MKAVVAAFNQEKALVGVFSVIVQPVVEPMDRFAELTDTCDPRTRGGDLHRTGTSRDTLSQGDQQTNNTSPSPTPAADTVPASNIHLGPRSGINSTPQRIYGDARIL